MLINESIVPTSNTHWVFTFSLSMNFLHSTNVKSKGSNILMVDGLGVIFIFQYTVIYYMQHTSIVHTRRTRLWNGFKVVFHTFEQFILSSSSSVKRSKKQIQFLGKFLETFQRKRAHSREEIKSSKLLVYNKKQKLFPQLKKENGKDFSIVSFPKFDYRKNPIRFHQQWKHQKHEITRELESERWITSRESFIKDLQMEEKTAVEFSLHMTF